MVIAMLTLPAGTAGYTARNLASMMLLSTLYSFLFSAGGLVVGWSLDLPVGAVVVVLAGLVFLGYATVAVLRKKRSSRDPSSS